MNINRVGRFEKVSEQQFTEDYNRCLNINGTYENVKLPVRATKGSAGYDFYSPVDFELMPNQSVTFPTGIRVKIDNSWFLMICPRSGLGFQTSVRLANTLGIIDGDYYNSDNEGHMMIKFVNHGGGLIKVKAGDRVAQGVFVPYGITYDDNTNGERNGGFGSSGK